MPNINEFKSRLRGGGARANQFKVTLPFPGYAAVGGVKLEVYLAIVDILKSSRRPSNLLSSVLEIQVYPNRKS